MFYSPLQSPLKFYAKKPLPNLSTQSRNYLFQSSMAIFFHSTYLAASKISLSLPSSRFWIIEANWKWVQEIKHFYPVVLSTAKSSLEYLKLIKSACRMWKEKLIIIYFNLNLCAQWRLSLTVSLIQEENFFVLLFISLP